MTQPSREVGQVAAELGLSTETLRYYERHEILPAPSRNAAGRRVYSDSDVHLIEVLLHLRNTGMPLASIAEFTRWVAEDPKGVPERLALLRQHRAQVRERQAQLRESLAVIDRKIADYAARLDH